MNRNLRYMELLSQKIDNLSDQNKDKEIYKELFIELYETFFKEYADKTQRIYEDNKEQSDFVVTINFLKDTHLRYSNAIN